jgi:TolB-like protein/ribosomal protein S18 acetylase RimI-like enzyme
MKFREFLRELHRRNVWKVAVAYTAAAVVLLEVLTQLFHNFEAPHWVLKVITTLLIAGLPLACLAAWGFEVKEGRVRSVPREPQETKPALPAPATTAPPSIAVLPFEDMSPEQDQKYLGHGIAEELLNALAGIEQLKVAARTSSFVLAGRGASMQEIGDTLHVRHVLEGSVRRSGQKLRITAQLIDVQSGFHLYTQAFDRQAEDIFEIQNDIAREITRALLPKMGLDAAATLVTQGTRSLEAYNLRLMARHWLTQPSPVAYRAAIQQLTEATRLDPTYADAWGDLSYVHGFVAAWATDPLPHLVEGHHAAETALAHSPGNVPALTFRAYARFLVHRDATASDMYYQKARQAGADFSAWAFSRAVTLDHPLGHIDAATAYLEEANRLDPLAHSVMWLLVWNHHLAGRDADAARVAEQFGRLDVSAPDGIAACAIASGDVPEALRARQSLAVIAQAVPEFAPVCHMYEFAIDDAVGDREHAKKLLDQLLAQTAAEHPVSAVTIAEGYKALGEFDRAIEWWSRAVDQHAPYTLTWMASVYRAHPIIGKNPRFLALLKRMGLESGTVAGAP